MFICIDGIDGAGKSTQLEMICHAMREQGRDVVTCRDPGGTKLGEKLREVLLGHHDVPIDTMSEMLLYMASRAQLVVDIIQPALRAGKVVVTDRYLSANVAYQGYAGGLAPNDIWQVGEIATRGVLPDLTIVLDLPAEVAWERINRTRDRIESRGLEFMQKVREGFISLSQQSDKRIYLVDASLEAATVHRQIMELIKGLGRSARWIE